MRENNAMEGGEVVEGIDWGVVVTPPAASGDNKPQQQEEQEQREQQQQQQKEEETDGQPLPLDEALGVDPQEGGRAEEQADLPPTPPVAVEEKKGPDEEGNENGEEDDDEPPLKKKRAKEFMSWFPSSAHIATIPLPVAPSLLLCPSPPPPPPSPPHASPPSSFYTLRPSSNDESPPTSLLSPPSVPPPPVVVDVADCLPLRTAHLTNDGTALVWDAATALELRGKHRMLSRSLGMGSIRVSAVQRVGEEEEREGGEKKRTREGGKERTRVGAHICPKQIKNSHTHTQTSLPPSLPLPKAVPVALLPPALALAVEEGLLSMAAEAPKADTDYFDKRIMDEKTVNAIEEERRERKRYVGGE